MKMRTVVFGVLTLLTSATCIRLGIWQLDRLRERRARNAMVLARSEAPPMSLAALAGMDTSESYYRRVAVRGIADYSAEVVHTSRTHAGTPGVYLLTPVRPLDAAWGDTSFVLVRGFLYSADARVVDLAKAREADTLVLEALVTPYPAAKPGTVRSSSSARAVRAVNRDTLRALLQRPLASVTLLALGDTVTRDVVRPSRVPPPSLSEGPHKSYAFQWFGFASVFMGGFAAFFVSERKRRA